MNPFEKERPRNIETTKGQLELAKGTIEYGVHHIHNLENPQPAPEGLAETGTGNAAIQAYDPEKRPPLIHEVYGDLGIHLPFSFLDKNTVPLGDLSSPEGLRQYLDIDTLVDSGASTAPDWAQRLRTFVRTKLHRSFAYESTLATLRSIKTNEGLLQMVVGSAKYSDIFHSMNSEGVSLSVEKDADDNLQELAKELQGLYGKHATVRDAIIKETGGRLPAYGDHVHEYALGVAGTLVTNDGYIVLAQRGASVNINRGLNVSASGGVEWNEAFLKREGLILQQGQSMAQELGEETGIKAGDLLLGAMHAHMKNTLGIEGHTECDITPAGMVRELTRGGSPEMMYLLKYHGSVTDALDAIRKNPHEDRKEIDTKVITLPISQLHTLLASHDAEKFAHNKAILNLALARHLL